MIDRTAYRLVQAIARQFCGHEGGGDQPPRPDLDPRGDTYRAALTRLQNPSALSSLQYWQRRDAIDWTHVDEGLKKFSQAFVSRFADYGVPVFVHGAYRSGEEQDRLFAQGVTKARAGQSAHNHGFAVDIVHYGHYWDMTRKEWNLFGEIGKDVAASMNLKLTWGGDWKSIWDPAHWEIEGWEARI